MTSTNICHPARCEHDVARGNARFPLARIQADVVIQRLRAGGIKAEAVPMSTRGDRSLGGDLSTHVGQFVTGLDAHLFNDDVDLTVHSSKDVPIDLNESVIQVALLERAPAFDLLLFPAKHEHLPSLEETLRDAETKVDAAMHSVTLHKALTSVRCLFADRPHSSTTVRMSCPSRFAARSTPACGDSAKGVQTRCCWPKRGCAVCSTTMHSMRSTANFGRSG